MCVCVVCEVFPYLGVYIDMHVFVPSDIRVSKNTCTKGEMHLMYYKKRVVLGCVQLLTCVLSSVVPQVHSSYISPFLCDVYFLRSLCVALYCVSISYFLHVKWCLSLPFYCCISLSVAL